MQTTSPALIAFVSLVACGGAPSGPPGVSYDEETRVRAIVDRLTGPAKSVGMPQQFVLQRRISIEEVDPAEDIQEAGDELAEEMPKVVKVPGVAYSSATFDTWVFANMNGEGVPDAWLESALKRRLVLQGMRHNLTGPELAKLHLAGTGDIKHLFSEIRTKRRGYEDVRRDLAKARTFLTSLNPLAMKFQNGPFEAGSLFQKTLSKILRDREAAKLRVN